MYKEISSKLNAFKTAKGNLVWGGALSLAWRDLKKTFQIDNIAFQTNNQHIIETTNRFNSSPFKPEDISEESVYIRTGYGNKTVKLINQQVRKKFPKSTIASIDFDLNPTDIIAYAYLYKELAFKVKFDLREQKKFKFNNKLVKSFYAKQQVQKKQIFCDQYLNQDSFVVHITNKSQSESLYLIKSSKELDADEVIQKVMDLQGKQKSVPLRKQDFFQMPCIELNCERKLSEFQGLVFANKQLSGYHIALILQQIKLNIDESGAKVENKGFIIASRGMALKPHTYEPKHIILNRSFWVVMKQPKKHPYICSFITQPRE